MRYSHEPHYPTHEEIWNAFLQRMRVLLAEPGTTQAALAARLGVDRGTVTRWLKGDRKGTQTPAPVLMGYMRALDLDPATIFGASTAGTIPANARPGLVYATDEGSPGSVAEEESAGWSSSAVLAGPSSGGPLSGGMSSGGIASGVRTPSGGNSVLAGTAASQARLAHRRTNAPSPEETPEGRFSSSDGEYVQIPWLEATASMGGGSVETDRRIISPLSFRADWILGKGSPAKMAVINASGGSMEPTIPDGAVVLIDESRVTDLVNGKIYFVCYGEEIYLKRLRVERGRAVALISDADGSEMKLSPHEYFKILGRAIWYGKEI